MIDTVETMTLAFCVADDGGFRTVREAWSVHQLSRIHDCYRLFKPVGLKLRFQEFSGGHILITNETNGRIITNFQLKNTRNIRKFVLFVVIFCASVENVRQHNS